MIFFIPIYLYYYVKNTPETKETETGVIDIVQEPSQTPPNNIIPISVKIDDKKYQIIPLANYEIAAKIITKNTLFDSLEKKLGPIDLGLIWGKLANENYGNYLHFRSSQRWLSWDIKRKLPYDSDYLQSHISHNHIIPADKNIFNALERTPIGKTVRLRGYLVSVFVDGRNIWSSSLSRNDTGNHACEVFYVNNVRIDQKIYK